MLTDEQLADGWIDHDGGPCPVPLDSRPGVLFRDGSRVTSGRRTARYWSTSLDWWQHEDPDSSCDIIAYKPENQHANAS